MARKIYKLVTRKEWQTALETGVFEGAPVDLEDGFIHFSTADQVEETARKHFHGQKDLLLVTVDVSNLGDDLKWEISRGGALFPHLYASLPTDKGEKVAPLEDMPDGSHRFPEFF